MKSTNLIWVILLLLSLAGGILVRLLNASPYGGSALMYLGLPWLVALLLALTARYDKDNKESLGSFMHGSLIVFLGSSFILGEGFLCVLFFLPIYFLMIGLFAFLYALCTPSDNEGRIHLAPLLLGLLALEGTHPALTLERDNVARVELITELSSAELHANLARPIKLNNSTSSGLSRIFPQPYQVDSDGFELGDQHTLRYRYARWLWGNVHEGELHLRIDALSDQHISVHPTYNSSYLANYLRLQRFDLTFTPVTADNTRVVLNVHYERSLDPAWYFGR